MLERTYFVAFKQLSIFSVLILFNIPFGKYQSCGTYLPSQRCFRFREGKYDCQYEGKLASFASCELSHRGVFAYVEITLKR